MAGAGHIRIKGAREHNLKNLDLSLPRGELVVITGVSGSGKSSLAFDTLYAEGYRKYMDSLSTRARQLLDQLPRPDVDFIEGLSPVIAIEQRAAAGSNPRSTVASVTEIADYARLLWSVCGEARCPLDGARITRRSLDDCLADLFARAQGHRAVLLAPWMTAKTSVLREELPRLSQRGFQRVRLNGEVRELDEHNLLEGYKGEVAAEIVIDRVVIAPGQRSRLADSLELAFREGGDRALVLHQKDREGDWEEFALSQHLSCTQCGTVYEELTPRHFSPDHAEGACPECGGLGETRQFDPQFLVPDPALPVKKGAIKPWRLGSKAMIIRRNALLKQLAEQLPFDANTPWQDLPEETRAAILHGTGERLFHFKLKSGNHKPEVTTWPGVLAELEQTRRETSSEGHRARLMAFQTARPCPLCRGERLGAASRAVRLHEMGFAEFAALPVERALAFVRELEGVSNLDRVGDAVHGLLHRLRFLEEVGLGYLTLGRAYASLSGGEAQRVRLATQLGMGLVGVVYVLDEPSIGLHPHDHQRLLDQITRLRDRGNAVLVVEHDEETIRAADHLVELGPGAGERGGHLVFQGSPAEALRSGKSITGPFLSGQERIEKNAADKRPGASYLTVRGARHHNLRAVTADFPVGLLTVVTGVSGSGKSSLVHDVLGAAAAWKLHGARQLPGAYDELTGLENFKTIVRVDQSPIGRSPRSNPATYVKLFDPLRQLYAQVPLAKVRGYKATRFSFNTAGGRCERCKGDGATRLDMQFLPDVYVECPSCHGKRYNRETLDIRFRGVNIAEALEMTVEEALDLFRNQPKIAEKLQTLADVGLGYLRLGQPAPTLSGGEAQRIKLALELSRRQQGSTLYLLDEPTTGLHWVDIQRLMDLLFQLREAGNTLLVIEHNLDVLALADWVVDLGPGGGEHGGDLLYCGALEGFLSCEASLTAKCLRDHLARKQAK